MAKNTGKSAAIRAFLAENPTATPSEIIAGLSARGIKVSPQLVTNVRARVPTFGTKPRGKPTVVREERDQAVQKYVDEALEAFHSAIAKEMGLNGQQFAMIMRNAELEPSARSLAEFRDNESAFAQRLVQLKPSGDDLEKKKEDLLGNVLLLKIWLPVLEDWLEKGEVERAYGKWRQLWEQERPEPPHDYGQHEERPDFTQDEDDPDAAGPIVRTQKFFWPVSEPDSGNGA